MKLYRLPAGLTGSEGGENDVRDKKHFLRLLSQNPTASVGFTLAAAAVFAARNGTCEPSDHTSAEWKAIARRLKSKYGDNLAVDEVRAEMDTPAETDERRTADLTRVRLTLTERAQLDELVESTGLSESEYVRRKLFGE